MRHSPLGDEGETLIEAIISMLMIGIAVAAVLGAVTAGSVLSGGHRSLTNADVDVKAAAERLKGAVYVPGANAGTYQSEVGSGVTVEAVTCWDGSATTDDVGDFQPCASGDHGLQLIALLATSPDGVGSERTHVLKRQS